MNQIEKRVENLEGKLGVNRAAETLDSMVDKFLHGKYMHNGYPSNLMATVVAAREADKEGELDAYIADLRKFLPDLLVDLFKESFIRALEIKKDGAGYRLQGKDESKADYLKYQIKDCRLVCGFIGKQN